MIAQSLYTVTGILLFAATFTSVQSSQCAVKAIQPSLREIRVILIQHFEVVQRAAQNYTRLVHRLTDEISVNRRLDEPVEVVSDSLERFVKAADQAGQDFIRKSDVALQKASDLANRNCPDENVDWVLELIAVKLRNELQSRIRDQSTPRLQTIVGQSTYKAIRLNRQALDDDDSDNSNEITLVLRDMFALLIELFTVEITDRQRQYFAVTEQALLAATVSAREL